jgi:leucyl aminopeptidase (aminopeptidase T)
MAHKRDVSHNSGLLRVARMVVQRGSVIRNPAVKDARRQVQKRLLEVQEAAMRLGEG